MSSSGPSTPISSSDNSPPANATMRALLGIAGILISLCVALAAIPFAILLLSKSDTYFRPEIALPTVLIIGVTAVLGVLGSIALAFYPQLRTPQQYTLGPLGLPDGAIGAVISLMLLIIFATTSLY